VWEHWRGRWLTGRSRQNPVPTIRLRRGGFILVLVFFRAVVISGRGACLEVTIGGVALFVGARAGGGLVAVLGGAGAADLVVE
jgi:hypothetical protein